MLNLAAAGGMDLASASDMVTDSMSALGIEATKSNVDEFGDKMAKTASKANTSVAQLGEAILTVGGTAKDLAGGTTELNTCLGILADNGIKGAEGGTALRNMILSLEAPTDQAAGKLEDLGMKVFDSAGEMRSMQDIMADLNKAMANMTSGERTQALNTIFNKVDLKSVNALLGTSTERWNELSGAIDNSTGAMQAMADVQLDNLEGDITLLKSALEGCGIAVYDHLNEPLRDAVKTVTEVVGDITKAVKSGKFDDLFDGIGEAIESVIELILKAGEAVGKIAPVATKVLGVAADAVSLLLDNIEGVVAAMAGVASVMATIKIASFVTNIMSAVKAFEAAETVITGVNAALEVMGVTMTLSTGGIIAIVAAATAALGAFIIANRDSAEEVGVNSAATKELCDEYDELHDSIEENRKASEERVSAAEQETAVAEDYAEKLEKLSKKENKSAGEKKRMKYYVDKLNEVLPDLGLEYDAEKDKLNKNTDAIKANIEARKLNAQISAYQTNYDEAVAEEVKLQDAREELDKQNKENLKWQARAQKKYDGISKKRGEAIFDYQQRLREAKKDLDKANEAVAESSGKLEENTRDLEDNAATQKKWGDKLETGLNTQAMNEALSDLQKLAKEGGVTISESVEAGIREGRYQIPDTVKGLKNLIKFDDAVQAAGLSGTQIPKALSEKISNGKISVDAAIKQVKNLAKFDEMASKAGVAGSDIPEELRDGVASGEVSIDEAIKRVNALAKFDSMVKKAGISGSDAAKKLRNGIASGKVSVESAAKKLGLRGIKGL